MKLFWSLSGHLCSLMKYDPNRQNNQMSSCFRYLCYLLESLNHIPPKVYYHLNVENPFKLSAIRVGNETSFSQIEIAE